MAATARVALLLLLATLLVSAPPARGAGPTYRWPVDGAVLVAYDPPDGPYGSGHRGVDLAADPGAAVVAMADGVVTFAGAVAGQSWVTVSHPDGVRTTVGPVRELAVGTGETVAAGDLLARATGAAHGRVPGLHVSARRGDAYLDPTVLVVELVATLVGPGGVGGNRPAIPTVLPLVPGTPPSPNRLVVVGGLASSTAHPPFAAADLGYGADDSEGFSYAGVDADGPLPYEAAHTWQGVHDAALRLRDQLRAAQAREPGRAVDLVGHSLGGLVAMYYLLVLHDATDPALPPVGRVATIASPLQGADLAAAADPARRRPVLGALLALADAAYDPLSLDAPVLDDLEPGSPVVDAVEAAWERVQQDRFTSPLAAGTEVIAVGALLDPVVPAWRSDLDGMPRRTVVDTHGGAPRGDATQELVEAFLAGRPLPAPGLGGMFAEAVRPGTVLISVLEQLLPVLG